MAIASVAAADAVAAVVADGTPVAVAASSYDDAVAAVVAVFNIAVAVVAVADARVSHDSILLRPPIFFALLTPI